MTTSTKIPRQTTPAATPQPRRFTVAEYYRMAEVGILRPEERVELIDGEILLMAPIGPLHAETVEHCSNVLKEQIAGAYVVRSQNPVKLEENIEPVPDLAIVHVRARGYFSRHPGPAEILLLIEVSDSSLDYDRNAKANLYAQANIPETWIMNLVDDCIETFTGPTPNGYASHATYRRGDRIAPATLPGVEFAVEDLLPPIPQSGDSGAGEGEGDEE